MAREEQATDYVVPVKGVGDFRFGRRTMRDQMKIQAEYSRLTEGIETPTEFFAVIAGAMATLKVLTVTAPDGWDIDEMDPLEEDTYNNLVAVHAALRQKEESFRTKPAKGIEATRAGTGEVSGVLVSQEVQPAAK
jgi:hypothetical protein